MKHDYKYAAQLYAEELADELGLDFDALPLEERCKLYERGMRRWIEQQIEAAERSEA